MPNSPITHDDRSSEIPFVKGDWVSATRTRNYVSKDTLLDWLDIHGKEKQFRKDAVRKDYDVNLDFTKFLFKQGNDFEDEVIEYLKREHGDENFEEVGNDHNDSKSLEKAEKTLELMEAGTPFILQAVLWNPNNRTFGMPDILARSDWINEITVEPSIDKKSEKEKAPILGGDYHYLVIDVKFTTLVFNATNTQLQNGHSSQKAYKTQLAVYNKALGRLQGYEPPKAYLLGRKCSFTSRGEKHVSEHSLIRLGPVDFTGVDSEFYNMAEEAADWYRWAYNEGADWEVYPKPSIPELWPNCANDKNYPWEKTVSEIAAELKELTGVWQIGIKHREQAHELGIFSWDDARLTPNLIGINGESRTKTVSDIININKDSTQAKILPSLIENDISGWKKKPNLEFFVDFETVTDINDDFSNFPYLGGNSLIFMIGCGYEKLDGSWEIEVFTSKRLTIEEEGQIVDKWIDYMKRTTERILGKGANFPKVYHWTHAEKTFLNKAIANRKEQKPESSEEWPKINWSDFCEVARKTPIVVKGAFGFGLKAIAKNLKKYGLTETEWGDGPADGLGAMVGAWYCDKQVDGTDKSMMSINYMKEIKEYNKVDCKVMWELINYLRKHHL
jgi:hypothetical protein